MAVFALVEDALAFGALGDLPSARAADLTMSPPTSSAEPQQRQSDQQFFIIELWRGLPCQDVSCSSCQRSPI